MFTGIVESMGEIMQAVDEEGNVVFTIKSDIANELKIDQSISHNGVCLTVTALSPEDQYQVVAVAETLSRSNLGSLSVGQKVNLERSMVLGGRLDGHIVQGHVDQTGTCSSVNDLGGSWEFRFEFEPQPNQLIVEKGSITINGVSLTCFDITDSSFKVAIIPYTFHNTNFNHIKPGDMVNLEFDIIGKYVQATMNKH